MESLKQLNLAMAYIEDHLAADIDVGKVAELAGCSEYHFRRVFSFLAGMTLSDYIRRRRLAQAALELRSGTVKVIDVAMKYGYESPDAFARAFQSVHGITPTEARKDGAALTAVPPMTFQLTIQGGNAMQYRIIEKDAFSIVGIKQRITLVYAGVNPEIDAMWARLTMEDIVALKQLSNVEPTGILCVSANFSEGRAEGAQLDQYIGVATSYPAPARWDVLPVAATTWAVFTATGAFPRALQDVWARIYAEWFPTSGYEATGGPEILWNESPDTSRPDYTSEIWVPIRKASGSR